MDPSFHGAHTQCRVASDACTTRTRQVLELALD